MIPFGVTKSRCAVCGKTITDSADCWRHEWVDAVVDYPTMWNEATGLVKYVPSETQFEDFCGNCVEHASGIVRQLSKDPVGG